MSDKMFCKRREMKRGKKEFSTALVLFFCGVPFSALAQEQPPRVKGPVEPTFQVSVEVLQRDIVEDETVFRNEPFPSQEASADSVRVLAKPGVMLFNRLEIYGLVGGSNLDLDFGDVFVDSEDEFNGGFDLAYGGGATLTFYRSPSRRMPLSVFLDYHYLRFTTEDNVFFAPEGFPDEEIVLEKITWQEHAAKIGLKGRHDFFEPYAGFRFSVVRGKSRIDSRFQPLRINFDEDDLFGIFVGTDIYLDPSEEAVFFIEGNIIDQNSIRTGIKVTF